jgi:cytochrome b6-f complex iron-sulfur subunit
MLRANVSPQTQATEDDSSPPSRREFLYCTLCASAALTSAGACAAVTWFAQPRPVVNRDLFVIQSEILPQPDTFPVWFAPRYFLVRKPEGLIVLDAHCPHLGSRVNWSEENHRFECVSHGGRYYLDGTWLTGPAKRGMDRYILNVVTPDGTISTPEDGSPVPVDNAIRIELDIHRKILGAPRTENRRR